MIFVVVYVAAVVTLDSLLLLFLFVVAILRRGNSRLCIILFLFAPLHFFCSYNVFAITIVNYFR